MDLKRNIARILADYDRDGAKRLASQRIYFQELDLDRAISRAALAKKRNGKKFFHQLSIGRKESQEPFERRLMARRGKIAACDDFDGLIRIVRDAGEGIPRIGPLTVYDTALRIGMARRVNPRRVFLHAGVIEGAEQLEIAGDKEREGRGFPTALEKDIRRYFGSRRRDEVEDILCLYRDCFRASASVLKARMREIRRHCCRCDHCGEPNSPIL